MSEINSNNDIILRGPGEPNAINAANFMPNVIVTMMKKEMKFNLDPNIQENLAQYINKNNSFSSQLKNQIILVFHFKFNFFAFTFSDISS